MISLILSTFNRYHELKIFLDSVVGVVIKFEIVIVDQNDIINLEPLISEYISLGLDITHIKLTEKNLANARNVGIAYAKYDIIGFPDDDCYYEDKTLINIIDAFNHFDIEFLIAKWAENEYKYNNIVKELDKDEIISFKTCPLSSITIFAKSKSLKVLSGFDSRLGIGQWFGAGEETDLIMRAAFNNYKVVFFPNVLVHHNFNKNIKLNALSLKQIISRARGTGAIFSKNNLSFVVVFKGLISPLIKILYCFNFKLILEYIFVFYGRITGYIKWNRFYS